MSRTSARSSRPISASSSTQHTGGWGATVWIVARIVYIPLYLAGVAYVRTSSGSISVIGLIMMLVRLAF